MKDVNPNEPLTGENATPEKVLYHLYLKPALKYAELLQQTLDFLNTETENPQRFYSAAIALKSTASILEIRAERFYEASKIFIGEEEKTDD